MSLDTHPETKQAAQVYVLDPFLSRKDGAAELYLIRHGDAFPDADDGFAPGTNYDNRPLSRTGREQARKLAAYFNEVPFDAIYCSPLVRTRETAAPLSELQNLPVHYVDALHEIELHRGETPPVDVQAMREQSDRVVRLAALSGRWDVIPNAEPGHEFRQRVVPALDAIAIQHLGQRVAVVTHGGVINIYVATLLGLERDFFFPVVNTSVTIVRVKDDSRVLVTLNDTCHLR